mmetsp:Transcript_20076/g.71008  ORF Transcript_20076/g.71008 Transcript_20076/m.71008 type:complete len:893 (-) Transcript_20076:3790-6468(-)
MAAVAAVRGGAGAEPLLASALVLRAEQAAGLRPGALEQLVEVHALVAVRARHGCEGRKVSVAAHAQLRQDGRQAGLVEAALGVAHLRLGVRRHDGLATLGAHGLVHLLLASLGSVDGDVVDGRLHLAGGGDESWDVGALARSRIPAVLQGDAGARSELGEHADELRRCHGSVLGVGENGSDVGVATGGDRALHARRHRPQACATIKQQARNRRMPMKESELHTSHSDRRCLLVARAAFILAGTRTAPASTAVNLGLLGTSGTVGAVALRRRSRSAVSSSLGNSTRHLSLCRRLASSQCGLSFRCCSLGDVARRLETSGVHRHAMTDERRYHISMAVEDGNRKSVVAVGVLRASLRTLTEQRLDNLGTVGRGRHHEGRAAQIRERLRRAVSSRSSRTVPVARARGALATRAALHARAPVDACAGIDERHHSINVAVLGCLGKRRVTALVGGVDRKQDAERSLGRLDDGVEVRARDCSLARFAERDDVLHIALVGARVLVEGRKNRVRAEHVGAQALLQDRRSDSDAVVGRRDGRGQCRAADLRLDRGIRTKQRVDDVEQARLSRVVQRRPSRRVRDINVGTGTQQAQRSGAVAAAACVHQRSEAVQLSIVGLASVLIISDHGLLATVDQVDPGAAVQQLLDPGIVALVGESHEQRPAIGVRVVNRPALAVDEDEAGGAVRIFDRLVHRSQEGDTLSVGLSLTGLGEANGAEAVAAARVRRRANGQQDLHDFGLPVLGSRHQRRRAVLALEVSDDETARVIDQQLDGLDPATSRRTDEECAELVVANEAVGTSLEQGKGNLAKVGCGSGLKRRAPADAAAMVDVRAEGDELAHGSRVTGSRSSRERCHAIVRLVVGRDVATTHVRNCGGKVARLKRLVQAHDDVEHGLCCHDRL